MDNVINFPTREDGCIKWTDHNGQDWFKYAVSFFHNATRFQFDIWATSIDDCRDRIVSLKQTALFQGQIIEETEA